MGKYQSQTNTEYLKSGPRNGMYENNDVVNERLQPCLLESPRAA